MSTMRPGKMMWTPELRDGRPMNTPRMIEVDDVGNRAKAQARRKALGSDQRRRHAGRVTAPKAPKATPGSAVSGGVSGGD